MRAHEKVERSHALENVLLGVDRATRLVEQLLILATVDPEATFSHYQQVDLNLLASEIITDLAPMARAKKIKLALKSNGVCTVLGEHTQLSLLLRNVIDNAIRYTPAGGSVDVTTSHTDGVKLQVRDTGIGIAQAEREQVLKRFYRISGNGETGCGLGLSIVKRIAELHEAQLTMSENQAGGGLLVSVIWKKP